MSPAVASTMNKKVYYREFSRVCGLRSFVCDWGYIYHDYIQLV